MNIPVPNPTVPSNSTTTPTANAPKTDGATKPAKRPKAVAVPGPAPSPTTPADQAKRAAEQITKRTKAAVHATLPTGHRPVEIDPNPKRTCPPSRRVPGPAPAPKDGPSKLDPRADQPRAHGFGTEVNNRSWHDQRKNVDAKIEVETPDGQKHTLTDTIDIEDESAGYTANFELEHDGATYEYRVPFDVTWDPDSGSSPHSVTPGEIEVSVDGGDFTPQRAPEFEQDYRATTPKVEVDKDATKADVSLEVRDEDGNVHQLNGEYEIPYRWGEQQSQLEQTVVVSGDIDGETVRYEVPLSIDIERRQILEWDAGKPRHSIVETGEPQRIE
jgi:hypothetical protein